MPFGGCDPIGDRDEAVMAEHFEALANLDPDECRRCFGTGIVAYGDYCPDCGGTGVGGEE